MQAKVNDTKLLIFKNFNNQLIQMSFSKYSGRKKNLYTI